MLVLKGNAFYEIDEECMRRKGLKFPEEAEEEPPTPPKEEKNQKKSPGEGAFFL